jgi:hypothetical protein
MSFGFTAYRVSVTRLAKFGADPTGLDRLVTAARETIDEHDEWFEEEISNGAPGLEEALRQLVAGRPGEAHGYVYAYALEVLCAYLGEQLAPTESPQSDDLDLALAAAGVLYPSTAHLLDFDPPLTIPEPDGFPAVTTVAGGECQVAADAWQAALPSLEDELRELASEYVAWFRACTAPGDSLVLFYY